MVSWRAPASILEAPGLDFEGLGLDLKAPTLDFCEIWDAPGEIWDGPWHTFQNAKHYSNAEKAKKANHLQGADAQGATPKAYSTSMAGAKKGGRRWSPPGGYN